MNTAEAIKAAREMVETLRMNYKKEIVDWDDIYAAANVIESLIALSASAEQQPIAWMFQHSETGRIVFADAWQIMHGFEDANKHLTKIGPLYSAPQASQPSEVHKKAFDRLRSAVGLTECDETILMLNAAVRIERLTAQASQPVALTDEQIQAVMFEVFDYAAIADGIEAATFERRDQQRAKMFAQDRKIRKMLRSLSATSQPSEAEIRAKALEEAARVIELYDDATMTSDNYMLDSGECADIIRALAQQKLAVAIDAYRESNAFKCIDPCNQRGALIGFEHACAEVRNTAQPVPQRDREADRKRFPDPLFNKWLDESISDAGHTVWDQIGDTAAAWAGWENRPFYSSGDRQRWQNLDFDYNYKDNIRTFHATAFDAGFAAASHPAPAQTAPVVPDSRSLHVAMPDEPEVDYRSRYFWRAGWNAYREAMLSAAPSAPSEDAKDKERLDWVERQDLDELRFMLSRDMPHDGEYMVMTEHDWYYGKTLRDAIDAAIAATAQQKEGE